MVGGNIISRGFGADNRIITRGYVEKSVPIYRPTVLSEPVDTIYLRVSFLNRIDLFPNVTLRQDTSARFTTEMFHVEHQLSTHSIHITTLQSTIAIPATLSRVVEKRVRIQKEDS